MIQLRKLIFLHSKGILGMNIISFQFGEKILLFFLELSALYTQHLVLIIHLFVKMLDFKIFLKNFLLKSFDLYGEGSHLKFLFILNPSLFTVQFVS